MKEIQDVCRICLVEHPETQISLLSVFEDEKVGRMMTYCTSLEVF